MADPLFIHLYTPSAEPTKVTKGFLNSNTTACCPPFMTLFSPLDLQHSLPGIFSLINYHNLRHPLFLKWATKKESFKHFLLLLIISNTENCYFHTPSEPFPFTSFLSFATNVCKHSTSFAVRIKMTPALSSRSSPACEENGTGNSDPTWWWGREVLGKPSPLFSAQVTTW